MCIRDSDDVGALQQELGGQADALLPRHGIVAETGVFRQRR